MFLPAGFVYARVVKATPYIKPVLVPGILVNDGIEPGPCRIRKNKFFFNAAFIHQFYQFFYIGIFIIMCMNVNSRVLRFINFCYRIFIN